MVIFYVEINRKLNKVINVIRCFNDIFLIKKTVETNQNFYILIPKLSEKFLLFSI